MFTADAATKSFFFDCDAFRALYLEQIVRITTRKRIP